MNAVIYIMQAGDCEKIGIASDVHKRQAQLQTSNPEMVSIHVYSASVPRELALQIERRVHELLARYRVRGEWFRCGLWEAIEALLAALREWRFRLGLKSEADIDRFIGLERHR